MEEGIAIDTTCPRLARLEKIGRSCSHGRSGAGSRAKDKSGATAAGIMARGSWLTHPGGTPGSLNVTNEEVALTDWISDGSQAKNDTEEAEEAAPRSEA
jgi:hypothetical protein